MRLTILLLLATISLPLVAISQQGYSDKFIYNGGNIIKFDKPLYSEMIIKPDGKFITLNSTTESGYSKYAHSGNLPDTLEELSTSYKIMLLNILQNDVSLYEIGVPAPSKFSEFLKKSKLALGFDLSIRSINQVLFDLKFPQYHAPLFIDGSEYFFESQLSSLKAGSEVLAVTSSGYELLFYDGVHFYNFCTKSIAFPSKWILLK